MRSVLASASSDPRLASPTTAAGVGAPRAAPIAASAHRRQAIPATGGALPLLGPGRLSAWVAPPAGRHSGAPRTPSPRQHPCYLPPSLETSPYDRRPSHDRPSQRLVPDPPRPPAARGGAGGRRPAAAAPAPRPWERRAGPARLGRRARPALPRRQRPGTGLPAARLPLVRPARRRTPGAGELRPVPGALGAVRRRGGRGLRRRRLPSLLARVQPGRGHDRNAAPDPAGPDRGGR